MRIIFFSFLLGAAGEKGAKGAPGYAGRDGSDGAKGELGEDGYPGLPGVQGRDLFFASPTENPWLEIRLRCAFLYAYT